MNIRVNDKWAITSDDNQLILNRVSLVAKGKNAGKVRYDAKAYFQTIEHLVERLTEIMIYESDAATLAELRQEMVKTRQFIRGLFNE